LITSTSKVWRCGAGLSAGDAPALGGRSAAWPRQRAGPHERSEGGRETPARCPPKIGEVRGVWRVHVRGSRGRSSASVVPSQRRLFVSRAPRTGRLRPPVASRVTSGWNADATKGCRQREPVCSYHMDSGVFPWETSVPGGRFRRGNECTWRQVSLGK